MASDRRSPSRSLSLPRLANVIPTFHAKASGEFSRERANVGIEEPLARPHVALAEPSTLSTMALIKEGSRSPALASDSGGVLVFGVSKVCFAFEAA
jgi:hypothetical protein